MGIKGLAKLIDTYTTTAVSYDSSLSDIRGEHIIVDFSGIMYKYLLNTKNYEVVFRGILDKFKKYNIKSYFIFDGRSPIEKKATVDKRKRITEKARSDLCQYKKHKKNLLLELNSIKDNDSLYNETHEILLNLNNTIQKTIRKSKYMKKSHINNIKSILHEYGIPFIQCNEEADLICSMLVKNGIIKYCLSDDTDMLAFGCNFVLRNWRNNFEEFDIYDRSKVLTDLNLKESEFLDLCILMGSDYLPRTIGIKMNNIIPIIKKYNNIETIVANIEDTNIHFSLNKKPIIPNTMERYCKTRHIFMDNNLSLSDIEIFMPSTTVQSY